MIPPLDSLRDVTTLSVLLRLTLAFLCGSAIGIERSYKNRPAGFRTHMLVCVGAAIAALTGQYLYLVMHMPTDISRLGAQVVSGLGFIGGGTIIVTRDHTVKGLTTAAGLWAAGVIGLAAGSGFFEGAVLATALIIIIETCFAGLSKQLRSNPELRWVVHYHAKGALDQVMRYCKDRRLAITNLQITGASDGAQSAYSAVITMRPNAAVKPQLLLEHVRAMEGIISVDDLAP